VTPTWRASAVLGLIAALGSAVARTPASATDATLRLTLNGAEPGWIATTVSGPDGGVVDVRELAGDRSISVGRMTLSGGRAVLRRATPWRCDPRSRRLVATLRTAAGAAPQTSAATITTPSCASRLRRIVVPAHVAPGHTATVRVTDSWHLGGISASLCARPATVAGGCTRVRLATGTITRTVHVRLTHSATLVLRTAYGQRLAARVDVLPRAPVRILVTGDSLVFGLSETLARDLGGRAVVRGDAHPGRGLSVPRGFDWLAHARRVARSFHADVTVVLLGGADLGYPMATATGTLAACCDAPWQAEYARRAGGMISSFLRDGRALVYWLRVPAPRDPPRARIVSAANAAVQVAGARYDDGVRVIDRVADVLAPHDSFHASIVVHGRRRAVRAADGLHLSNAGIRIAVNILKDVLRSDGLLT
jgi:hypothetical protein